MEETINNLYNKETYLDKYGGSLVITILTLFVSFIIYSYFLVSHNFNSIRADWNANKCKPTVLPFAGLINAKAGESKMEFTQKNFTECTQSILTYLSGEFLAPINYSTHVTGEIFSGLAKDINSIRSVFARLRDDISDIVDSVLSRFLYALMPIRRDIIKLKATLGKTEGVFAGTIFTSLASYMGLRAFLGAFIEIIIKGLIALAAFIVAMWIVPFTWPVAGAATAFFVAIAAPFAIAVAYLKTVIHTSNTNIPSKPKRRCFDKDTIIMTTKGEKRIVELQPGDELDSGNIIVGVLKCSSVNVSMYRINNTIVSGTHKYQTDDETYEYVCNHPDAVLIPEWNDDAVYCLTTTKKYILVNGIKYLDWDEVTDIEFDILKSKLIYNTSIGFDLTFNTINKYLDGGFLGNTLIKMNNGKYININQVSIDDTLYNGEKVLGVIKMKADKLYKYDINGDTYYGGFNLMFLNKRGIISTIETGECTIKEKHNDDNELYLYHLITNTDTFYVGNTKFCDYNYGIDAYLDNIL